MTDRTGLVADDIWDLVVRATDNHGLYTEIPVVITVISAASSSSSPSSSLSSSLSVSSSSSVLYLPFAVNSATGEIVVDHSELLVAGDIWDLVLRVTDSTGRYAEIPVVITVLAEISSSSGGVSSSSCSSESSSSSEIRGVGMYGGEIGVLPLFGGSIVSDPIFRGEIGLSPLFGGSIGVSV